MGMRISEGSLRGERGRVKMGWGILSFSSCDSRSKVELIFTIGSSQSPESTISFVDI
jgi:hypothetical protein